MSTECPICYEKNAYCNFTCGHSFCQSCTKSWHNKGKSTCPMCRASMCFKGFIKMKKKWYQEKLEDTYKSLVNIIFEELMEEYSDVVLQFLEVVQNRYEYTLSNYPNISCEELDIVLRMTWVDVDFLMNNKHENVYEPKTYTRYLFINGTEYNIKNLSYTQHVINVMYKNGKCNSSYVSNRCKF